MVGNLVVRKRAEVRPANTRSPARVRPRGLSFRRASRAGRRWTLLDDVCGNASFQALETFESRLGLVIRRLAEHPFLAGDQFTAADISVSYALLLGLRTGNYTPGSVERAYLTRTTTHPAYARAMESRQATKAWAARSPSL